jgi:hypothetical protein
MKITLSSKRRRYLTRVIIFFLIVAGLIVCMTGCRACFPEQHALIIPNTECGSVTDPRERTLTYDEGTVVDLVAEAGEDLRFVE